MRSLNDHPLRFAMQSLQAQFLVACPRLPDPNFYQTVVLVIHHDEDGAFGMVINRPTNVAICDIWEQVCDNPCDNPAPLHLGGPVEGPLMALHGMAELSENQVIEGVYFETDTENLDRLVRQSEHPFRLFSGYSGWAPEQLDMEMEAGGWLTTPATADDIFSSDEELWRKVADRIGRHVLFPNLDPKHSPSDPMSN